MLSWPWRRLAFGPAVHGFLDTIRDGNLHYLDGLRLYGPDDADDLPLPDRLHPDGATHRRIGERFAHLAFAAKGPLAPAGPHR